MREGRLGLGRCVLSFYLSYKWWKLKLNLVGPTNQLANRHKQTLSSRALKFEYSKVIIWCSLLPQFAAFSGFYNRFFFVYNSLTSARLQVSIPLIWSLFWLFIVCFMGSKSKNKVKCVRKYNELRFRLLHKVIKEVHIEYLEQSKKVHNNCLGSCLKWGKRKEGMCLVLHTKKSKNDLEMVLFRAPWCRTKCGFLF